jgi:hypothetical protein
MLNVRWNLAIVACVRVQLNIRGMGLSNVTFVLKGV